MPLESQRDAGVGLQTCLELLKGPSDERRLIGLLMVTKLLPFGDEETLMTVWNCVQKKFLKRLMLPLTNVGGPRNAVPMEASTELHLMSMSVALAVLSSCCRIPQIARSSEMLDFLPEIVKVWRKKNAIESWKQTAEPGDAEVVQGISQGALECLMLVCRSGVDSQSAAIEHGAVDAANLALQDGDECGPPQQKDLLAVQLLGALFSGEAPQTLHEYEEAIAEIVLRLSRFLVLERQEPDDSRREDTVDPAMLQLETLHTLLLILPLAEGSSAMETLKQNKNCGWAVRVHQGLRSILQSRTSAVQKHSALQLACCMTDFLGPSFLVDTSGRNADKDSKLFQIVVETCKVEVAILLRDAANPDLVVQEMGNMKLSDSTEDTEASATPDTPGPSTSTHPITDNTDSELKASPYTTGQRVAHLLPVCFSLLECCIGVISHNERLLEDPYHTEAVDGMDLQIEESVIERSFSTISECVRSVLEFVGDTEEGDSGVVLACARFVGTFLAEVPHVHSKLFKGCVAALANAGEASEGVQFLVPALLQLTDGEDAAEWRSLCRAPSVLSPIVEQAVHLASSPMENTPAAAPNSNDIALGQVCSLLLNLFRESSSTGKRLGKQDGGLYVSLVEKLVDWMESKTQLCGRNIPLDIVLGVCGLVAVIMGESVGSPDDHGQALKAAFNMALWGAEVGHDEFSRVDNEEVDPVCLDMWERLLQSLTFVVEVNPSARQLASNSPWVNQMLSNELNGSRAMEDVCLQLFFTTISANT